MQILPQIEHIHRVFSIIKRSARHPSPQKIHPLFSASGQTVSTATVTPHRMKDIK
jgi:hypothetical protein